MTLLDVATRDTAEIVNQVGGRIEGHLQLLGDGRHLTPRNARTRSAVRMVGCRGVEIDATVEGPHLLGGTAPEAYVEALEAQHAFEFIDCHDMHFRRGGAHHVYGDFVNCDRQCTNIEVQNFDFHHNGRQGFGIASVDGLNIHDGYIGDVRRAVFDLEPHSPLQRIDNIRVRDVRVGAHRLKFLAAAGRGWVGNVSMRRIDSTDSFDVLVASDPAPAGRYGPFTLTNMVTNKRYGSRAGRVMQFTRVDGVIVREITQPMPANRDMVTLQTDDCSLIAFDKTVTWREKAA